MTAALRRFRQLPCRHRRLLLEAAWRLIVARTQMAVLPFRHISPQLGVHMCETIDLPSPAQETTAAEIGWAIRVASKKLPLGAVCIHQAIGAKRMLAKRNIPATFYLGTRKASNSELQAHAWVTSGEITIIGDSPGKDFTVVSTFS